MRVLNLPFTCAFTALFATLSLAHPEPGVCRQSCSPKQIEYAFKSPRYMGETKRFCREYLGLKDVVKEISEEVKVVVTKVVEEKPKTRNIIKTITAPAPTITTTSTATSVSVTTLTSTSTVLVPSTVSAIETLTTSEASTVFDTLTETITTTVSTTVPVTTTVTRTFTPVSKKKRDAVPTAYRPVTPQYVPYDLAPKQISSACKKLNVYALTMTRTKTITKKQTRTRTLPCKTLISTLTVTVTPNEKFVTVTETLESTATEEVIATTEVTPIETITVSTTTVTAINTFVPPVTTFVATETSTSTVTNTVTTTIIETVLPVCQPPGGGCMLDNPGACCEQICLGWDAPLGWDGRCA